MIESSLSGNLEHLMRLHGIRSLSDLAKATKLPQPTLHHILAGSTKNPRKKALGALADYFSISIEQLVGDKQLPSIVPEIVKENLNLKSVPVIHWEMLKSWPPAERKQLHLTEVLLDRKVSDFSFAVVLQDSSMEPMFPENALLIFDYERKPKDRDFVVVLQRTGSIVFNRLFIENHEPYIKQNLKNGDVKLIKLDKDLDQTLGTLIEVRVQY